MTDRELLERAARAAGLSENQARVLRLACTHGHLTQGCRTQSDYGALTRTIYSLRKRGLLDVMDKPTAAGRELVESYKTLRPLGGKKE